MKQDELLEIFDREQRMEVYFPGVIRDVSENVVRHSTPGEHGFIPYSRLDEATVDAAIEEQIAYYEGQNLSFEWKVYDHDRPADLRQRLAARGFEIDEPEALMVLDMEQAPDFYWNMELPEITQITDEKGVQQVIEMEDTAWQSDHRGLGVRLTKDLLEIPDMLNIYAIMADDKVVSAAWTYYHPPSQFSSLWGGTTLEPYRKRGYYTALLAKRAREARIRWYRYLTVDASPMSRPILEKHGFQFLGFSTPCNWTVTAEKEKSKKENG